MQGALRSASKSAKGLRHLNGSASATWLTVIGLEIHAQIRTGFKLFSPVKTSHDDIVNSNVHLLDSAFPGTLPVLDHNAVRLSLRTALALGCIVNPRSTFDRKHYFYHDIPSSYQITQHYNPLARQGKLPVREGEFGSKRDLEVGIKQLQIEQDTAKTQTIDNDVLIDLNRAGTGLMEIVTEPDMRSPEEAGAFVRKLQQMLRRLGACEADMEKGQLRIDVNVSVHKPGTPFGTRCEIKNINSVRFLQQAIESERKRHIRHYEAESGAPLRQETRQFDEVAGETYSLRTKEEAEDYRYMPDANLPAMVVDPAYLDQVKVDLPEMPWDTVTRLTGHYGVAKRDVETLLALDEYEGAGIKYLEEVTGGDAKLGKRAINWIAHELLGQLGRTDTTWTPDIVPSSLMRELVMSVEEGRLSGTNGKSVIRHIIGLSASRPTLSLSNVLDQLGLSNTAPAADLRLMCQEVITSLPDVVVAIRKGNEKPVMRLVGEVMKRSKGQADPKEARRLLLDLISKG